MSILMKMMMSNLKENKMTETKNNLTKNKLFMTIFYR
jgi:hypothetical protein